MSGVFEEKLHAGYAQKLTVGKIPLADERSAYQHIQIFDSVAFGHMMALDGVVQITERDEASYSEMLTHPAIVEHGAVRTAMVVGGGDGAVAEEILKHRSVERVDLVDIDGRVVDLCRINLPHVHKGVFDDPRLNLMVADAFEHLKSDAAIGAYDLIVADRPDPVGPAEVLFGQDFYSLLHRALTPRGLVALQTGVPFLQGAELRDTLRLLRGAFARAGVYLTVTPSYVGGYMALTWGSKGLDFGALDEAEILRRFAESGVATEHYTPRLHKAAFALPAWIEKLTD